MIGKKRAVRIFLLASLLGTVMMRPAGLGPTPEVGARPAGRPRGIVLQVEVSDDDDGPPPCTVASPCENWF
jgi:hypothetical protein